MIDPRFPPEPRFPIYALLWDEDCFEELVGPHDLLNFEQPDLEEGPHRAWDSNCHEYVIMWCSDRKKPRLHFICADAFDRFRECVLRYQSHLGTIRPKRCAPENLLDLIEEQRRSV